MQIKVYPTKKNALNLRHPTGGQLQAAGSLWVKDGFTNRMLSDGLVTTDPGKAWQPPADQPSAQPGAPAAQPSPSPSTSPTAPAAPHA